MRLKVQSLFHTSAMIKARLALNSDPTFGKYDTSSVLKMHRKAFNLPSQMKLRHYLTKTHLKKIFKADV